MKNPKPSEIYRASVEPPDSKTSFHLAYVRATSETEARDKIGHIMSIIDSCSLAESMERLYNVKSAATCIQDAQSATAAKRMFEVGRAGTLFVRQPLFLLREPADLIRIWAEVPQK
ncbi:MAG: hypothetical protein JWO04_1870 [Gammaproteobacteria bacterium]|nr:hypothetical protein [Gammaproteobacteria bacterium]